MTTKPPIVIDTPILREDEAAALLNVRTFYLKRSSCPRIKHGGVVRYHRDAVLAWHARDPSKSRS